MYQFSRKILSLAFLVILLMFSPKVRADSWQNEMNFKNATGADANNLEKWLDGDVLISDRLGWQFGDFTYSYDPVAKVTKLKWYNGIVKKGETVNACVKTNKDNVVHKYKPRWSSAESLIGALPALSHYVIATGFGDGRYNLVLSNTAEDGNNIVMDTVQVRTVDTLYTIEHLSYNDVNAANWTYTRTNITLGKNQSETFLNLNVPSGKGIVYRAKIHFEGDPNVGDYIGQWTPTAIPTVSEWGLIIMVGLLLMVGAVAIWRRLKVVPA